MTLPLRTGSILILAALFHVFVPYVQAARTTSAVIRLHNDDNWIFLSVANLSGTTQTTSIQFTMMHGNYTIAQFQNPPSLSCSGNTCSMTHTFPAGSNSAIEVALHATASGSPQKGTLNLRISANEDRGHLMAHAIVRQQGASGPSTDIGFEVNGSRPF